MTKRRVRVNIGATAILLLMAGYFAFFGFVRREHFCHCLPTNFWSYAIRLNAQLPERPAAIGVAMDLLWSDDEKVRSAAAAALADPPLESWSSCNGHAVRLEVEGNNYIVLVLHRDGFFSKDREKLLYLLRDDGAALDRISCPVGLFFDLTIEQTLHEPDGASFVIRLPDSLTKIVFHRTPDAMGRYIPFSFLDIRHGSQAFRLDWNQIEHGTVSTAEWEKNGLCRVGIRDNRFVILWPPAPTSPP